MREAREVDKGSFRIATEFLGVPQFPANYYGAKRPHADTLRLRDHVLEILNRWHPYGVRGVGYQLESRYGYAKDDPAFARVERQVRIMRLNGAIPFDWIIDESRAIERPVWWQSPQELLAAAAEQFRIHMWAAQPYAVIVVCEKHGLGGVLRQATEPWRVPLATLGGTYSHSFAGDIIEWIAGYGDRPVIIFYLGDYDPTGILIPKWLHRDMYAIGPHKLGKDFDPEHYIKRVQIKRLAVNNFGQAQQFGGIPRPTKLDDNTHAVDAGWPSDLESVEVDSIPPERLQATVTEAIESVVDRERWERSLDEEERLRDGLSGHARNFV